MKKTVCIYKITNTITGDFYIGQTIDFNQRIKAHKRIPPPKMRDDVEKYGWDAFKFEIVEECNRGELTAKERHYIKTLNPAYNILPFGYEVTEETRRKISLANLGRKVSEKTKEKIRRAKKGKKFSPEHCKKIQKRMSAQAVDLFGKPVICLETQEVFTCMVEAAKSLNIKPQNISAALHGRQKTAGGYTWKYADESLNLESANLNRKRILCVETGQIFNGIIDAAEKTNTSFGCISNVLHGRAITAGGFHWKYADDRLNDKIRDETERHDNRKAVICVETGEIFPSISDAAKHYGILNQGISDVLNGKKVTSGGFHWKYADGRPDKTREKKQQKIHTKSIMCIETGKIFPSIKIAAAEIGICRTGISSVVNGRRDTAGGFHWKYLEDKN